jgi:hypothetical protein
VCWLFHAALKQLETGCASRALSRLGDVSHIGRNTTIPTKKSQVFRPRNHQQALIIRVLEGECEMAAENKLISSASPRQGAGRFRTRWECSAGVKMAPCIITTTIS